MYEIYDKTLKYDINPSPSGITLCVCLGHSVLGEEFYSRWCCLMRHSQRRIRGRGLFCPVNSLTGQLAGRSTLSFYGLVFYLVLCMVIGLLLQTEFGFLKHLFCKTSYFFFFSSKFSVNRVFLSLADCLTLQVIIARGYNCL